MGISFYSIKRKVGTSLEKNIPFRTCAHVQLLFTMSKCYIILHTHSQRLFRIDKRPFRTCAHVQLLFTKSKCYKRIQINLCSGLTSVRGWIDFMKWFYTVHWMCFDCHSKLVYTTPILHLRTVTIVHVNYPYFDPQYFIWIM